MFRGGEALHKAGDDGARRAKRWLEASTRVSKSWLNTDPAIGERCEFKWPNGDTTFSFDIGGFLCGGEFEGHSFLAECKNYTTIGDQPSEYDTYLAKCYAAYLEQPKWSDHFMWITWHPFSVTSWKNLCGRVKVREAALAEHRRLFGVDSKEEAEKVIDENVVDAVSERLWLIVLSRNQERLVISRKHLALIRAHEIQEEE